MKNKSSETGESIFKKKGFFVALYSCLGAVMVLALVISFSNLTTGPGQQPSARGSNNQDDALNVNADGVESYQSKAQAMEEQAWWTPKPKATAAPTPSTTTEPKAKPSVTASPTEKPIPTTAPTAPTAPAAPAQPAQPAQSAAPADADATASPNAEPNTTAQPNSDPTASNPDSTESSLNEEAEAVFSPFTDNEKMVWPVYGDIAMVFSMDKLVYDPTLDQYRANNDLRISAQEGTLVKAGADGKVLEIDNNHVYGNYVVIDHGNGWASTYGQLMDNVLVKEGEIVKAGQVIGGVGQPSYYGSLNGTHVNLRVTKEDEPVDPITVLAALEE